MLAVLARAYFKRAPLWLVILVLFACMLAFAVQGSSWYPHENELRPLSERLIAFAAFRCFV